MSSRTTILEESEDEGELGSFHLLIMSPDSFSTVPIPKRGLLTLGRSSEADVHIDDPLASRQHARLHIGDAGNDAIFRLEDVGSANGTRARDVTVTPRDLVPVAPGEAMTIGSTVLMIQHNRQAIGRQRLWSHAYFETRLEAECERAEASGGAFALVRLGVEVPLPWTRLAPIFSREVAPPHVFAAYGPNEFEILVMERGANEADALAETLRAALAPLGASIRTGTARYPRDGRSVDALLGCANTRLRPTEVSREPIEVPPSDYGPVMLRIHEMASRAAAGTINVLVLGETGVGKEVMSRKIHRLSPRAAHPFVALNCAGLAESLIESELFGHEKGAFTGALQAKPGLLESAEGGTVLLDEIGELPLSVQAKLLRVLETREVTRVGAVRPRPIDVRFISATNRDLEEEVVRGSFRRDLFFRLNGLSLTLPPLRERTSELPALTRSFLARAAEESRRRPPALSHDVMDLLEGYNWPGNIRELRNVIERALLLCEGPELLPEHFPIEKLVSVRVSQTMIFSPPDSMREEPDGDTNPRRPVPAAERQRFIDALEASGGSQTRAAALLGERQRIIDALEACAGSQTRAAALLGMPRRTFISRLDQYGIPRPRKNKLS